jgi:hypothetical protein
VSRWTTQKRKRGSYLVEMLKHRYNQYGALGALAAGTLLSIPFGFGVALLPVLAYAAGTTILSMFIPQHPRFREVVDRRKRYEEREAVRQHLVSEIVKRAGIGHALWKDYERLLERRNALAKIGEKREGSMSLDDIERLDDATIDFLGLWLGRIAIDERSRMVSEKDLERNIENLDRELQKTEDMGNKRRLMKAKDDLETMLTRRREMRTRDAAAQAAMLSIADAFDELYQRVMANPTSQESMATELRVTVERLNIEEDLDYILHEEVEAMLNEKTG